ncbi:MAG: hypothetical protein O7B32_02855 [Thaumarchaeota archaeon]|nr:hypothetical protein [Nitrososphaerota archaeon]
MPTIILKKFLLSGSLLILTVVGGGVFGAGGCWDCAGGCWDCAGGCWDCAGGCWDCAGTAGGVTCGGFSSLFCTLSPFPPLSDKGIT